MAFSEAAIVFFKAAWRFVYIYMYMYMYICIKIFQKLHIIEVEIKGKSKFQDQNMAQQLCYNILWLILICYMWLSHFQDLSKTYISNADLGIILACQINDLERLEKVNFRQFQQFVVHTVRMLGHYCEAIFGISLPNSDKLTFYLVLIKRFMGRK